MLITKGTWPIVTRYRIDQHKRSRCQREINQRQKLELMPNTSPFDSAHDQITIGFWISFPQLLPRPAHPIARPQNFGVTLVSAARGYSCELVAGARAPQLAVSGLVVAVAVDGEDHQPSAGDDAVFAFRAEPAGRAACGDDDASESGLARERAGEGHERARKAGNF